ncbi:MAG: calcium-binding protein, partial [Planctomycetaceae bacterium]|nr:calcium-binding protein [Planctomycetaceae bacterium]
SATNITNDPESLLIDTSISNQIELQITDGHGLLDIGPGNVIALIPDTPAADLELTLATMDVVTGNDNLNTIQDAKTLSLSITGAEFFAGEGATLNATNTTIITDEATGFLLTGGLSIVHASDASNNSYTGVTATISSASLLGIDAIDLKIGGTLKTNSTNRSDNEKIDWSTATSIANDPSELLSDQAISQNISLQVIDGTGSIDIGPGNVIATISDSTFTMSTMDVNTGNSNLGTGGTITDAKAISLFIGNANFFAGDGASLDTPRTGIITTNAVGFSVTGSLTVNSIKDGANSYTGVETSIAGAELVGISEIALEIGGDLRFNTANGSDKINWTTATNPTNNPDDLLATLDVSKSIRMQVINGYGLVNRGPGNVIALIPDTPAAGIELILADMDVTTGNSNISSGTISNANTLSLAITGAQFFIGDGATVNTQKTEILTSDALGFLVNGNLIVNSVKDGANTYTGIETTIDSAALLGIDAVDLELGGQLRFNKAPTNQKLDWTTATNLSNNSDNLLAILDVSQDVTLQVLSGYGSLNIGPGFVLATVTNVSFTMSEMDITTGNANISGGLISGAKITSLDIGNANLFAGVGAALNSQRDGIITTDAVGLSASTGFKFISVTNPVTGNNYSGLEATGITAAIAGLPDKISISLDGGLVAYNKSVSSHKIDWTTATVTNDPDDLLADLDISSDIDFRIFGTANLTVGTFIENLAVTIGIEKGQDDFVLSNGVTSSQSITGVDYLKFYGAIVNPLLVGYDGTGLELSDLKIGMISVQHANSKYTAFKASGSADLKGLPLIKVSGSAALISNKSTDPAGKVLDFVNTSSNVTDDSAANVIIDNYDGDAATNVSLDLDGDKGDLLRINGYDLVLDLAGFVVISGDLVFEKQSTPRAFTLDDGTSITADVMTFGGSNISIFGGVNGPASNSNAIGMNIGDSNFGLVIAKDGSNKYYGFNASGTATFVGLPGFDSIRFGDIDIDVNQKSSGATSVIDFSAGIGGGFEIDTGMNSPITVSASSEVVLAKLMYQGSVLARFSLDGMDFDAGALLFAVLNDPVNMLNGLEGFFGALDNLANSIDNIRLPLIGSAGFDDFADSIRNVRTNVLGEKSGQTYQNGVGKWLQTAAANGDGVIDALLGEIRKVLYNGLGSVTSPFFQFVVADLDDQGRKQYLSNATGALLVDDSGDPISSPNPDTYPDAILKTKLPTSADDIELSFDFIKSQLIYNIRFRGTLVGTRENDGSITPASIPLDLSAGIPGLNVDIDADLEAKVHYMMSIGLGIGSTGNSSFGVFLDTSGMDAQGNEAALYAEAGLSEGSTASGTLGFLKMSFLDVHPGGSGISGTLYLNLEDAGGDGTWQLGERLDVTLGAKAEAYASLLAQVATTAGAVLPSISTTIKYHQILGEATLSTDGGARFDMGAPSLTLENVTLNVGSLFDSFLGETFSTIHEIVKPLKPVVDLLTTEIDLGIATFQFIDIAYLRLPAKTVDIAKKVLKVLKATIDFLEKVSDLSSAGDINFGTFNLTEKTLENPDAELDKADTASASMDTSGLSKAHRDALKGPDQSGLDSTGKSKGRGKKTRFKIPVLEEPMTLIDFMLGRGEATLFWYDLPDLELEFEYEKTFPVFGPLNAKIYGLIGAYTNFDFGYDTRGISQWMATDFNPADAWMLINGFYLDDHGKENTVDDQPEMMLRGKFAAGVSLGIGGLIEVGVMGGLEMEIDFDLNDFATEFEDGSPVGDGKFYGSELVTRIIQGPQCLFDVKGELSVFLEAFIWVGLDLGFLGKITVFEARSRFVDLVIAEFSWECVQTAPQDVANIVTSSSEGSDGTTNTLVLEYGGNNSSGSYTYNVESREINPELNLENLIKDKFLETNKYTSGELVALRNTLVAWQTSHPGEDAIVVSTGERVEVFLAQDIDGIQINGTPMGDLYNIKYINGRVDNVEVNSGDGDDIITILADVNSPPLSSLTIHGGMGDDNIDIDSELLGEDPAFTDSMHFASTSPTSNADYVYQVYGDSGHDQIDVQGFNDTYNRLLLDGGSGDDMIFGHDGPDKIVGGSGFDAMAGYAGIDVLLGGDETVAVIDGVSQSTTIDAELSPFYQVDGTPFPGGYFDTGFPKDSTGSEPFNITGDNHVYRFTQGDFIQAGPDTDYVDGGTGWDEIFGGGDNKAGDQGESAGDADIIIGGAGNDLIDAGKSMAQIQANAGDDYIVWSYNAATSGGGATLNTSGGGDEDTMVITLSAGDDTVHLREDPSNSPDALMTINSLFNLGLEGIEHIRANAKESADTFTIDDLLTTEILDIDLTLGSDQVSEFSIVRDSKNNYRVYPSDFSDFYKTQRSVELTTRGMSQRVQIPANAPDAVQLYYGYDESQLNNGYLANNAVTISKGMTANEVHSALSLLATNQSAFNDFTVSLSPGDTSDASRSWDVTFSTNLSDADALGTRYKDPAKVVDQYFYRYDINEGGNYIFEDSQWIENSDGITLEGGTPRLANQITPATRIQTTASPAFSFSQSIWLAEGLDKVNLYYDYVDENTTNYSDAGVRVEINAGMTTTEIADKVDKLLTDNGFTVSATISGSGTPYDPWVITTGTDFNNLFAYQYKYQEFVGVLAPRNDTRVYNKFYRLNQSDPVEYLFNADGSPSLIGESTSIDAVPENSVQFINLENNEQHAILWYGDDGVGIHQNETLASYTVSNSPLLPTVTEVRDSLVSQLNVPANYSAIVKDNDILLILTNDDAQLTPLATIVSGIGITVTGLGETPIAHEQHFYVATVSLASSITPLINDIWKIKDNSIEIARTVVTSAMPADEIRSSLITSINQQSGYAASELDGDILIVRTDNKPLLITTEVVSLSAADSPTIELDLSDPSTPTITTGDVWIIQNGNRSIGGFKITSGATLNSIIEELVTSINLDDNYTANNLGGNLSVTRHDGGPISLALTITPVDTTSETTVYEPVVGIAHTHMNWTNKSAAVVGDRWKLTLTENTSVPTDVETTHLVTTNDDLDSIREALAISLNTAVATAGLDIFASVKNDLLLVTNTNGTSMSLLLEVLDSTTPDLHTGTFDTTDPPTSPVTFTVERIPVAFDQWVIKKDEVEIGRYEVLESDAKSTIQAEIDAILAIDKQSGYTVEIIPASSGTTRDLDVDTTTIDLSGSSYTDEDDAWIVYDKGDAIVTYTTQAEESLTGVLTELESAISNVQSYSATIYNSVLYVSKFSEQSPVIHTETVRSAGSVNAISNTYPTVTFEFQAEIEITNEDTWTLSRKNTNATIESSLQQIPGLGTVTVSGEGTSDSPWAVQMPVTAGTPALIEINTTSNNVLNGELYSRAITPATTLANPTYSQQRISVDPNTNQIDFSQGSINTTYEFQYDTIIIDGYTGDNRTFNAGGNSQSFNLPSQDTTDIQNAAQAAIQLLPGFGGVEILYTGYDDDYELLHLPGSAALSMSYTVAMDSGNVNITAIPETWLGNTIFNAEKLEDHLSSVLSTTIQVTPTIDSTDSWDILFINGAQSTDMTLPADNYSPATNDIWTVTLTNSDGQTTTSTHTVLATDSNTDIMTALAAAINSGVVSSIATGSTISTTITDVGAFETSISGVAATADLKLEGSVNVDDIWTFTIDSNATTYTVDHTVGVTDDSVSITASLQLLLQSLLASTTLDSNMTVQSVTSDVISDTFTAATPHLFIDGDIVRFATSGNAPLGLTNGQSYYVVQSTDSTFKVSTSAGGTPVDMLILGTGTESFTPAKLAITDSATQPFTLTLQITNPPVTVPTVKLSTSNILYATDVLSGFQAISSTQINKWEDPVAATTTNNGANQSIDYTTNGILWYQRESTILTPNTTISQLEQTLGSFESLLSHDIEIVHNTTDNTYEITLAASSGAVGTEYESLMLSKLVAHESDVTVAENIDTNGLRQRFTNLANGTLWYDNSGVATPSSISVSELKSAIENLPSVTEATVVNNSQFSSWDIVLQSAILNTNNGRATISNIIVSDTGSTELSPNQNALYNSRLTGQADQQLFLEDWQQYTTLQYGDTAIEIDKSMSSADVASKIRELTNRNDVIVTGDGIIGSPWYISLPPPTGTPTIIINDANIVIIPAVNQDIRTTLSGPVANFDGIVDRAFGLTGDTVLNDEWVVTITDVHGATVLDSVTDNTLTADLTTEDPKSAVLDRISQTLQTILTPESGNAAVDHDSHIITLLESDDDISIGRSWTILGLQGTTTGTEPSVSVADQFSPFVTIADVAKSLVTQINAITSYTATTTTNASNQQILVITYLGDPTTYSNLVSYQFATASELDVSDPMQINLTVDIPETYSQTTELTWLVTATTGTETTTASYNASTNVTATEIASNLTAGLDGIGNFTATNRETLTIEATAAISIESDELYITAHGFIDGEVVQYTASADLIAGLTHSTDYYVLDSTLDSFKLSLVSEGNAIDISAVGIGDHTFTNLTGATTSIASGISLNNNIIEIVDHGLINGDSIQYNGGTSDASGLVANANYFVISATNDTFQLSSNEGGASIDLTSVGTGTQTFESPTSPNITIAHTSGSDDFDLTTVVTNTRTTNPGSVVIQLQEAATYTTGGNVWSIAGLDSITPRAISRNNSTTVADVAAQLAVTISDSGLYAGTVVSTSPTNIIITDIRSTPASPAQLATYSRGYYVTAASSALVSNPFYAMNITVPENIMQSAGSYIAIPADAELGQWSLIVRDRTNLPASATGSIILHNTDRLRLHSTIEGLATNLGEGIHRLNNVTYAQAMTTTLQAATVLTGDETNQNSNILIDNDGNQISGLTWSISGLTLETISISSAEVDTLNDRFTAVEHPFSQNDLIRYVSTDGTSIGGLTVGQNYFVVNVTPDSLELSEAETGSTIFISSAGSGSHIFTEPIPSYTTNSTNLVDLTTINIALTSAINNLINYSASFNESKALIEIIPQTGANSAVAYNYDDGGSTTTNDTNYVTDINIPIGVAHLDISIDNQTTSVYVDSDANTTTIVETLSAAGWDATVSGNPTINTIELPANIGDEDEILTIQIQHPDSNQSRDYQIEIATGSTPTDVATTIANRITTQNDINGFPAIYTATANQDQISIQSSTNSFTVLVSSTKESRNDFTGTREPWIIQITNANNSFTTTVDFTDGLANALSNANSSMAKVQERYTIDGYWSIQRALVGDASIHTMLTMPTAAVHYLPQTSVGLTNGDQVVYDQPQNSVDMRELKSGSHYVVINATELLFSLSETGPVSFDSPSTGTHVVRTGIDSSTDIAIDTSVADASHATLYATEHGLTNGQQVRYIVDNTTEIAGLVSGQYYYIANATADSYQLVQSLLSLVPIDIDALPIEFELTKLGNYTVVDPNTQTSNKYIRPYSTIREDGPRMLAKEVWDDLDGDGSFEKTGEFALFEDPAYENDGDLDRVTINGSSSDDYLLVGHEVLSRGEDNMEIHYNTIQITHQQMVSGAPNPDLNTRTVNIILRGIDKAPLECGTPKETFDLAQKCSTNPTVITTRDEVIINGLLGDDRIIAGLLPNSTEIAADYVLSAHVISELGLYGGDGDDRLVGSKYVDVIHLGTGNDTVTSNEMGDTFISDNEGAIVGDTIESDHLIEARDANFSLTTTTLEMGGQYTFGSTVTSIEESAENIELFESFEFFGGAKANGFSLDGVTKEVTLDGTEGSDTYVITLSKDIIGKSNVYVVDSGTGSIDTDRLDIRGGPDNDTLHLDADTTRQQLVIKKPGTFTLTYRGASTSDITETDEATDIQSKLNAIMAPASTIVTGLGTEASPWKIQLACNALEPSDSLGATGCHPQLIDKTSAENKFFRITSSDETIGKVKVSRSMVTRIEASLASSLIAGKPDLDAMFDKPVNQIQTFYAVDTGDYRLKYQNQSTNWLNSSSSLRHNIEESLNDLSDITAQVTGTGTQRDQWKIELLDGPKDYQGNFYLFTVELRGDAPADDEYVTPPMDIADAAATVQPSVSISEPATFQRVYYDFSAEIVETRGGNGNDTFISDDSMASMKVYGDRGNDNFLIGRVLNTVRIPESVGSDVLIDVVDGLDSATPGISYNADFFGGRGDDYFEVNHNVGVLRMFGEA